MLPFSHLLDDMHRRVRARATEVGVERAEREFRAAQWKVIQEKGFGSFILFCLFFIRITTKTPGEVLPLALNEIQRLFCMARTGLDIILKARQIGMTTLELARDAWFALTHPNSTVAVITAPHKTDETVKKVVQQLDFMLSASHIPVEWKKVGRRFEFANGSTIVIMDAGGSEQAAGKMGRGGTYHRVHITELAFFPFAKSLLSAILKAVPLPHEGGELVIESTPNGVGGEFHALWEGAIAGTNGFSGHFYAWYLMDEYRLDGDDPEMLLPAEATDDEEKDIIEQAAKDGVTITRGQLAWWRQKVSQSQLDTTLQEYAHNPVRCFLLSGRGYFGRKGLDRLQTEIADPMSLGDVVTAVKQKRDMASPLEPFYERLRAQFVKLNGSYNPKGMKDVVLRVWDMPVAGKSYLISADTSGGVGRDYQSAFVWERGTGKHVATLRSNRILPSEFARQLATLGYAYGGAQIAVERNNHGHTVLYVLASELKYPFLWKQNPDDPQCPHGFDTNVATRTPMIDELVDSVESGDFKTRDIVFVQEARSFVQNQKGRLEAAAGAYDDTVMCAAIGWRILCGPRGRRGHTVTEAKGMPFG